MKNEQIRLKRRIDVTGHIIAIDRQLSQSQTVDLLGKSLIRDIYQLLENVRRALFSTTNFTIEGAREARQSLLTMYKKLNDVKVASSTKKTLQNKIRSIHKTLGLYASDLQRSLGTTKREVNSR